MVVTTQVSRTAGATGRCRFLVINDVDDHSLLDVGGCVAQESHILILENVAIKDRNIHFHLRHISLSKILESFVGQWILQN